MVKHYLRKKGDAYIKQNNKKQKLVNSKEYAVMTYAIKHRGVTCMGVNIMVVLF